MNRASSLVRLFVRSRAGSTAVEFAMILPVFLAVSVSEGMPKAAAREVKSFVAVSDTLDEELVEENATGGEVITISCVAA